MTGGNQSRSDYANTAASSSRHWLPPCLRPAYSQWAATKTALTCTHWAAARRRAALIGRGGRPSGARPFRVSARRRAQHEAGDAVRQRQRPQREGEAGPGPDPPLPPGPKHPGQPGLRAAGSPRAAQGGNRDRRGCVAAGSALREARPARLCGMSSEGEVHPAGGLPRE